MDDVWMNDLTEWLDESYREDDDAMVASQVAGEHGYEQEEG